MFNELLSDIAGSINELRYGAPVRTITVAKPFCSPARNIITAAFAPYGVKCHRITERTKLISLHDFARRMKVELRTHENLKYGPTAAPAFLPMAIVADVTVNEKAAAWAEYLLLRTGLLYVPGKYQNPRNEQWAAQHNGRMPPAWDNGTPWIEASCSNGIEAWQGAKQAIKQAQNARKQQQKGKGRK